MSARRPVAGTVGLLGVTSNDSRRIDPAGFTVRPDRPLPLLAVSGPGDGHVEARVVGLLDEVTVEDDGRVRATGAAEGIDPGTYECGMDLRDVTARAVHRETAEPFSDEDWTGIFADQKNQPVDFVELIERGEMIAVTLYEDHGRRAAFPGCTLVVS